MALTTTWDASVPGTLRGEDGGAPVLEPGKAVVEWVPLGDRGQARARRLTCTGAPCVSRRDARGRACVSVEIAPHPQSGLPMYGALWMQRPMPLLDHTVFLVLRWEPTWMAPTGCILDATCDRGFVRVTACPGAAAVRVDVGLGEHTGSRKFAVRLAPEDGRPAVFGFALARDDTPRLRLRSIANREADIITQTVLPHLPDDTLGGGDGPTLRCVGSSLQSQNPAIGAQLYGLQIHGRVLTPERMLAARDALLNTFDAL